MDKVLFIASCNPFIKGGGSQAVLAYMESVVDIYGTENVDIMIPQECIIPSRYANLGYIKVKKRKAFEKYFDYIVGNLSRFTIPITKAVKRKRYSICIINGGVIAGNAVTKLKKQGIKVAVIHHNYEPEYHADNKTIESLNGHFLYYIAKAEKIAYKNADYNLFLTNQDKQTFFHKYGKSIGINTVIGCYETKYSETSHIGSVYGKEYSIAISGSLCDYQTIVGVTNFYDKYYTIAKNIISDLKILLTGRNPDSVIRGIVKTNPDFQLVANPEKILEEVSKAKIFVCPTNIGGGLKLRVMDGLKCGMPVLVHEISARGYDFYYDKPYFKIYSDEVTFSNCLTDIIRFMDSVPNYETMIFSDYVKYFGFENGKNRLRNVLYIRE